MAGISTRFPWGTEGEAGNFRRAVNAEGWKRGADASGDENLGEGSLAKPGDVFLAIAGGQDGGPDEGQDDLAAVSVTTEDESHTVVLDAFYIVGVMLEEKDGAGAEDPVKRQAKFLFFPPVIAGARKVESFTTAMEGGATVGEVRDTGSA